jgi:ribonuclease R
VVSANRAGFGFVRSDELAESIFLPPREMAGLMHGDQVRVAANQASDGRWSGTLIEVLARGVGASLLLSRYVVVRPACSPPTGG